MDESNFGQRLKRAFGNASNTKIAAMLGISAPAVQHYVSGRVPNSEMLQKIAALTNCNLHWLLTGQGQQLFDEKQEMKPQSSSNIEVGEGDSDADANKTEIPWNDIYVLFSGLERFPDDPQDLESLKMELEVVYHEIQKRLKQADLLKRRYESNPQKSTERD